MAVKIQLRRGNASAVPALDVAEPGWDVDTKTLRVGDGTGAPARIPTTKSTGAFDFSAVSYFQLPKVILGLGLATAVSLHFHPTDPTTGLFSPGTHQVAIATNAVTRFLINNSGATLTGDLTVSANGKLDGVDISNLNPTGVNGIMAKLGDNSYAFRSLVPGNGIAPMLNSGGSANPGGAAGDIIISIATNPTFPGTAAAKIPAGTTGERAGISPVDGHFRYNTTTKSFEGRIDGEWRALVDYVEGKTVSVPSQFPSIQDAINYYDNRVTKTNVFINLAAGTHLVTAALNPGSKANRIQIQGPTPIYVELDSSNPITAVSGTPGNYLVTYKLAADVPSNITVDHSIIVPNLIGSGDCPVIDYTSTKGVDVLSANLAQVKVQATANNIADWYTAGDYILYAPNNIAPLIRRVTTINDAATLTVDSAFPIAGSKAPFHRRFRRLTGTLSASASATITGSGTSFLTELNVGDVLISVGTFQFATVTAIASNTSLTVSKAITITAEIVLQMVHSSLHVGCWKINSIDTIARTVTVINTTQNAIAPPRYGMKSGKIAFPQAAVLYTSASLISLVENQYIGLSNVTARYTGVSPGGLVYGVQVDGGEAYLGYTGFVNGAMQADEGGIITFGRLFISGVVRSGTPALALNTNSSLQGSYLHLTGNATSGLNAAFSKVSLSTITVSGNASTGINGNASDMAFSFNNTVSVNGAYGINLDGACYLNSNQFSAVMNTGDSGWQVHVANNSFMGSWNMPMYIGNGSNNGIVAARRSSISLSNPIVANCSTGVYLLRSGEVYANGVRVTNNTFHGILAAKNSFVSIDNSTIQNSGDAIALIDNSFVDVSYSTILKTTGRLDIVANRGSSALLATVLGSGASSAMVVSPLLNAAAPANKGSYIYTA